LKKFYIVCLHLVLMIWKLIGVILSLFVVLFLIEFVYQIIPSSPVEMKIEEIKSESFFMIDYDNAPMYWENLRFNHNNISYFIDGSCSKVRREAMIEAFRMFESKTKNIYFYEVDADADIDIECSNKFVEVGDNLFAAGEGGPVRVINTSHFKIIKKGRIFIYDDPRCDFPIVELHELGHVFGFDHSNDSMSIMFPYSRCEQKITAGMIELVNALYSIEALADVRIGNLTAIKKGRYLDFNLTILNDGIIDVFDVNLSVVVDERVVKVFDVGEIDVGSGRIFSVENFKLPSRNSVVADLYVDKENAVRELNEKNNVVRITT